MGARGRRGLILGLRDLSDGFQTLDARKQKRLADAFAREKFDYRKQQDAAEERRLSEALAAQIANQEIDNQRQRRAGILNARDSMFQNMIRKGNLDLATQRETRLAEALAKRGSGGGTATMPAPKPSLTDKAFDLREATKGLAQRIAAEKPGLGVAIRKEDPLGGLLRGNRLAMPPIDIELTERDPEKFMPEASRYTAASDLPVERESNDPLLEMGQDEWESVAQAAVLKALGGDPSAPVDEDLLMTVLDSSPAERRRWISDIPRLFSRPPKG